MVLNLNVVPYVLYTEEIQMWQNYRKSNKTMVCINFCWRLFPTTFSTRLEHGASNVWEWRILTEPFTDDQIHGHK